MGAADIAGILSKETGGIDSRHTSLLPILRAMQPYPTHFKLLS